MDLRGRVALVTGAGSGIGRATALAFAAAGADVLLHANRSAEAAEAAAEAARARGVRADVLRVDLADRAAVDALPARAEGVWGRVDVLVNNAGVTDSSIDAGASLPMEASLDQWDRVLDVNARAPCVLTAALGRRMAERGGGAVVNVASVAGWYAVTDAPLYSLSKTMLLHATRQWALALAPKVRVNAVVPGWTATGFGSGWILDPDFQREVSKGTPLKRLAAPEEIAEAILLLAENPFATGVTLPVDGGLRASLR